MGSSVTRIKLYNAVELTQIVMSCSIAELEFPGGERPRLNKQLRQQHSRQRSIHRALGTAFAQRTGCPTGLNLRGQDGPVRNFGVSDIFTLNRSALTQRRSAIVVRWVVAQRRAARREAGAGRSV
jgi:hypothetical protein